MNLLNLVVTKKCGTKLYDSMFVGHGYQCIVEKILEIKDEIPFAETAIEGFIYQPGGGWQKLVYFTFSLWEN